MAALCKIEVILPLVSGSRGLRRGDVIVARSNMKELGVARRGPRRLASPWLSLPRAAVAGSERTLLPQKPEVVKIAS